MWLPFTPSKEQFTPGISHLTQKIGNTDFLKYNREKLSDKIGAKTVKIRVKPAYT